jgi:hypothetical protein
VPKELYVTHLPCHNGEEFSLIIPNVSTHPPSRRLRRDRRATHIQCCPGQPGEFRCLRGRGSGLWWAGGADKPIPGRKQAGAIAPRTGGVSRSGLAKAYALTVPGKAVLGDLRRCNSVKCKCGPVEGFTGRRWNGAAWTRLGLTELWVALMAGDFRHSAPNLILKSDTVCQFSSGFVRIWDDGKVANCWKSRR